MTKLITKETLRKWGACDDGYEVFNQLFPKGATLAEASKGLIENGHQDWSDWLWRKCRDDEDYISQISVIAGDYGTATTGWRGTATAGWRGTATAGDEGTATAGDYGTAMAGDEGTAMAGDYGTAMAGDEGTATAGWKGTATAGDEGTAMAGDNGTATAGVRGCIILKHWNGERYITLCANVGIDGIKPNTPYHVVDGKIVEKGSK